MPKPRLRSNSRDLRSPTRRSDAGPQLVTRRLDNGVWLLHLATPAPGPGYRGVASVQLWVAAGAAAERSREHGCAHLLEHMVFKPYVDPDDGVRRDLASTIEALGGDANAFTSHDETVFHATVPADAIHEATVALVTAAALRDVDGDLLAGEREVVLEEIRQYRDDPAARSIQQLMADLYGDHPYARPVLGEPEELRRLTPGIVRGFRRRVYRGERLVLVVAGPLSKAARRRVDADAERLLGRLPAGPRPRRFLRATPRETPAIRVQREDLQEVYLRLGWIGGAPLEADGVALDVAAVALGQGESSRLAITRRKGRLVSDAYASFFAGVAGGTFVVSAQTEVEHVEAATEALLAEVETLATIPMHPEELARARALLQSSLVYRRETAQGQAHALGYFASASGHLGAEAEYFEALRSLTPACVQRACATFLSRERAAVTALVPSERVDAAEARRLRTRIRSACEGRRATSRRSGFGERHCDPFGTVVTRHRSGLRVVARPDATVPVVGTWMVWPGGLRVEKPRETGISSLTAALLTRGTTERDGDSLAREVEGLAAVLDGFSGHNSIGLQAECLREHAPTVLARLLECATSPAFAESEIDEARRIAVADLEADLDDVGHIAYRTMLSSLYGRHPLGRDLRGTPETLARLDRRQLVRNWSRRGRIDRAVLALAGDVDLDATLAELDRLLAAQPDAAGEAPALAWPGGPPKWPRRPSQHTLERDREQGHIVIGFPGLAMGDPEQPTLDVLCSILGGQAGRLFESIRERRGLAYQVGANAGEYVDGGHVVVYAAASQDKLDAAHRAILDELAAFVEDPASAEELARAKRWLLGQFESGMQRRSRVASRLVFGEAYGLGADHYLRYPERVEAVDRPRLASLARRLLDPKRRATVLVRAP